MQITTNFSEEELAPNGLPDELRENMIELAQGLQGFRDLLDVPCNVHVAYRDPEYNARVGGSPTSDHVTCLAADVDFEGKTMWQVWEKLSKIPNHELPYFDQIIWYPYTTGHIHFGFGVRMRYQQLVKLAKPKQDGSMYDFVTVKHLVHFPGRPR